MKAFISLVYLQTNAVSDEKIIAALLMVTPEKIWFHYSPLKLNLLKKLNSSDAYFNAYHNLSSIDSKVQQSNWDLEADKAKLFKSELHFNNKYLHYLSDYSSGLLQFSDPKPIADFIDEKSFANYYKLFVGEQITKEVTPKGHFNVEIKKQLSKPGLSEKANINYKLSPSIIHGLMKETDISLITKNGDIKAFQAIDFSLKPKSLVENLYEFEVLVHSLKKFSHQKDLKNGTYKIIAVEPSLQSEQHKLFDQVHNYKSDEYKLVDPAGFSDFTDKVLQDDYKKFSEFILGITV